MDGSARGDGGLMAMLVCLGLGYCARHYVSEFGKRFDRVIVHGLIEPPADDVLALDEAIGQLQKEKPHLAEIVMLRYFTGMSVGETAGVLGKSVSTITRDWRYARAWLAGRLGDASPKANRKCRQWQIRS